MAQQVFTEFNEDAYNALIEDKVFENISGYGWISEEAWNAFENGNISIFIYDLTTNCNDAEAFKDFGLSCLVEHSQALALAKMIEKHGF